jgi:hypothetical protein
MFVSLLSFHRVLSSGDVHMTIKEFTDADKSYNDREQKE